MLISQWKSKLATNALSYILYGLLIIRNKKGKRPFYYVKSYEVERMLTRKGAIDTKERDVRTLGKDRINCMLLNCNYTPI